MKVRIITMHTKKINSQKGYTLFEALAALLILLLVSAGMANGIRFGIEQYYKAMKASQAKVLCSTLSSVLSNDLRFTTYVAEKDGTLEYLSPGYSPEEEAHRGEYSTIWCLDDDGNPTDGLGQIAIGTVSGSELHKVLGGAAYPEELRARVTLFTYADDYFTVTLEVGDESKIYQTYTFDVLNLNHAELKTE